MTDIKPTTLNEVTANITKCQDQCYGTDGACPSYEQNWCNAQGAGQEHLQKFITEEASQIAARNRIDELSRKVTDHEKEEEKYPCVICAKDMGAIAELKRFTGLEDKE